MGRFDESEEALFRNGKLIAIVERLSEQSAPEVF